MVTLHDDGGRQRSRAMRLAGISGATFRLVNVCVILLTTPLLVAALGESAFGVFVTITALSGYLALSDLGIGAGLLTVLGKASETGDDSKMSAIVGNALWILLVAGMIVTVLGLTISMLVDLPRLLGAPPTLAGASTQAFQIFVIGFGLQIPLSLAGRIQSALQNGAEAAFWLAMVTSLSSAAAALSAWVTGSVTVTVASSVCASCAVLLVQTIRVIYAYPWLRSHRSVRFERTPSHGLVSSSGWLFLLQLSAVVAFQTDVILVAAVLGSDNAAIFHSALRMFSLVSLVTTALAAQFWPATAAALSGGGNAWVKSTHSRLAWQLPLITALAGVILTVTGQTLIRLWLGPALVPPVGLLVALALWTTYGSFVFPYSQLLNGAGILKPQVALGIGMAIANLAISLALTRWIGLPGPPLGSLLAHITVALVPTLLLTRSLLRRAQ